MTRSTSLAALVVASALAIPALASAQDRDDHHDDRRDDHRVEQGHDDHDRDHGHDQGPVHAARPAHDWHKGDRLPADYRDNRYVVDDWQARHLHRPPSGYHWVNVNGDYVLAAVATGVIADLLLNP